MFDKRMAFQQGFKIQMSFSAFLTTKPATAPGPISTTGMTVKKSLPLAHKSSINRTRCISSRGVSYQDKRVYLVIISIKGIYKSGNK